MNIANNLDVSVYRTKHFHQNEREKERECTSLQTPVVYDGDFIFRGIKVLIAAPTNKKRSNNSSNKFWIKNSYIEEIKF